MIITIALCLACSIAYAAAALIQAKHAHLAISALARMPILWVALALNALGAALHVTSLGFGPLTLIQPLGVLTLVIAVPFAAMSARRKVTPLELRGMTNTVIGLAGLALIITTSGSGRTLDSGELVWLLVATTVVVSALGAFGRRRGASPLWEATAGGIAYSVCSAMCKTVVVTASEKGVGELLSPIMVVAMAATVTFAIAATVLTQWSYRAGLGAPLAVTNLVNPATAAAIGVLLLGEHLATTPVEIVIAVVCALLSGLGVIQLTRARDVDTKSTETPTRENVRV
ncbi:hypothetical protein [Actinophytocola oryzae]|uniref:Magnesium transporter NIPA n=1 Tax=Actinophytocola oryzae TaxID=502181 RepID=A0A4R7W3R1_9PSEU|nr:hypothetical protein [Actinophytocola oryzae]TDV57310.1 hypothetical protein CLV71_101181 [Actinophytocola oryzae]